MGILKGRFILVHAVIEEDKHLWVSRNYRNNDEQGFFDGIGSTLFMLSLRKSRRREWSSSKSAADNDVSFIIICSLFLLSCFISSHWTQCSFLFTIDCPLVSSKIKHEHHAVKLSKNK